MSFNNAVQNSWGKTIGFRCFECGGIFPSMWGEICNGCREKDRQHKELVAAIRENAQQNQTGKESP